MPDREERRRGGAVGEVPHGHRREGAPVSDAKKTGKGKDGVKTNPLLQSILGKVNKDGDKD